MHSLRLNRQFRQSVERVEFTGIFIKTYVEELRHMKQLRVPSPLGCQSNRQHASMQMNFAALIPFQAHLTRSDNPHCFIILNI